MNLNIKLPYISIKKTKKAKEQKKILNSQQKTLSLGVPTLAMSGP